MVDRKIVLVHNLAVRYGFRMCAGLWRREWPSGKEWAFKADGSNATICDEYGRIIRSEWTDGITAMGMFAALNAEAPWRGEIGNRQPRKAKRIPEGDE